MFSSFSVILQGPPLLAALPHLPPLSQRGWSTTPACVCVLSRFSRVWLCNLTGCSPPGSSVRGNAGVGCNAPIPWIFLPRDRTCISYVSCFGQQGLYTCATWEVTVKVKWKCKWLSGVWLCHPMDWTVACQAPLSMEFSRPEQWTGLLFPSTGNLPVPGTEPKSPALQADSSPPEPLGKP